MGISGFVMDCTEMTGMVERRILEVNNASGPGGALTPQGLTSKGVSPMPDHDTRIAGSPQSPTTDSVEDPGMVVPHTSRDYPDAVILVSPEDFDRVMETWWTPFVPDRRLLRPTLYARSTYKIPGTSHSKTVYLHRFILGLTDRMILADHINHNGLDCRRSNLRAVTRQQSAANRRPFLNGTSAYKGVSFDTRSRKWRAKIRFNYRRIELGTFDSEVEAALAYDAKARDLFGEFAFLNFPDTDQKAVS